VVTALALAISGRSDEAVDTVEGSMPLAQRLASELPLATGELTTARLLAFWLSGRLREALQLAHELYGLSLQAGLTDWAAFCSALKGRTALALGQVRTAFQSFRDAVTRFRVDDRLGFLPWSLSGLAHAAALTGAQEVAEAALAEADAARTRAHRFLDFDIELGRAWVVASRGQASRAAEIATSAAERCSALGQHAFAALAWHDVARLGAGQRAASELSGLAASIDGEMAGIMAAHAEAIATDDAEALELVSGRLEERGAMLVAAEAAARAGAVHRAHYRAADARRCWGRSRGLQALAEDGVTPALATLGEPDGLTRREREVATLAARSLASRVIAERLSISVRTVDNHLYQAYRKLGVSGRRELRSLLGPLSVDVGA
jgi:DNA-binding CsgD family transcriptional regulator